MSSWPPPTSLGDITVDWARATVDGPSGKVVLRHKALEVLKYFIERPETPVSKDELLEALWPNVIVSDEAISQCVSEIRKALGHTARDLIKTLPRRGYMLNLAVPSLVHITPAPNEVPSIALNSFDGPSIAVLPFVNLSEHPEDVYLADGITEDIITELSRFSELFIIARNSSFRYRGLTVDVRQVGRDLGVQYVLEGSIRRVGQKLRVTAQLIEADSRRHIWAERYDCEQGVSLLLQDEVARTIVALLAVQVHQAELDRVLSAPTMNWNAYHMYLRATDLEAAYHASYDRQKLFSARQLLVDALKIDPGYARAYAALSNIYMSQWVHRWDDDCPWREALDESYRCAREAVRLAPQYPESHVALAQALTFLRQHEAAVSAAERAVTLNRNLTSFRFSYVHVLAGQAQRAVDLLEAHMRLDPFYQPNAPAALGFAYYMLRHYGQALSQLSDAIARAPNMAHGRYTLAMVFAQLGEQDRAQAEVAQALRIEPWYRISRSLTAKYFKNNDDAAHVLDGLRKAGFPD